jgi:ubiquinol-cytochrome c reductase cytochrome b subunit
MADAAPSAAAGTEHGPFYRWLNARFPIELFYKSQLTEYYAPKNFNFWYYFGVLSLVVLVLQIVTGIFLTMNYKPSEAEAFSSVEYIMRDVEWGWLLRYLHSTGASAFFIVVYLHMFRALLYSSYKQPRELIWIFGMLIGAIPGIGEGLVEWIRGDYSISDITLNRFFALHVVAVPLVLILLVVAHLVALREVGSNNPDGIEIKARTDRNGVPLDGIPFHPYYTYKDLVGVGIFLILFAIVVFFAPTLGGLFLEKPNFEPANALNTPEHIAPVWYFTPYYAILRAVPDKLTGAALMALAVLLFFFLPWLDRCKVKSIRYRGLIYKLALAAFTVSFIALGWLGLLPAEGTYVILARIFSAIYFAFFLLMPIYTRFEKTKPLPERVTGHG